MTEAALFGEGAISTGDYELNAVFEADGRSVYFTRSSPDPRFALMTILTARFEDGQWQTPEVAPFSGRYSEVDPVIAPDGNTLYYISQRPAEGTAANDDYDIWAVDRTAEGWGPPRRLPAPVNSDGNEYYPGVTRDGTVYFSAQREGGIGGYDLYRARPTADGYAEPENLGAAINSEAHEIDLYVAPDERYIIFVSYREGGQGRGDLYVSHNDGGTWTPAHNLGDAVNTPFREYTPSLTPDGKYLLWTSDRSLFTTAPPDHALSYEELTRRLRSPGNGLGDLYQIELAATDFALQP
jgi:Tol biopolymer transport system component